MRIMEFKMERQGLLQVGQEVEVTEESSFHFLLLHRFSR